MFNVHIFISGRGNYDTFKKSLKHYQISKIIILKSNKGVPEDAQQAHLQIKEDCEKLDMAYEEVEYEDGNVEDEIVKITAIKKKNQDSKLFFNATGGRKPEAIMAVIASLWVGGMAYYWSESASLPLEFPIPKVSVNNLAKNRLHLKILEYIASTPKSQTKIRNEIKILPGTTKPLSPQALSRSIKALEDYGLVKKTIYGRETIIEITMSGKIARGMIMDENTSNLNP